MIKRLKGFLLPMFFTFCASVAVANSYDAIVYGGTPAGVVSAINLAQKGHKVLLIERTGNLGGMYAGGLMTAEIMHMQKGCISGMAQEYYIKLGYNTPEGFFHKFKHGMPAYFFECKGAEKTFVEWVNEYSHLITIIYRAEITKAHKKKNTIVGIELNNAPTVYLAAYFVDCSYEGDLMKYAGVSYAVGREAKSKYNEEYAGIRFQKDTLYGTTVDENGKRLPFFRELGTMAEGGADSCVNAYNYRTVLTQTEGNKLPISQPDNYDESLYYAAKDYLLRNPNAQLRDFFAIIKRGNGKTGFNTRQSGELVVSVGLLGLQREYPLADYAKRDSIRNFYEKYTKGLFYFLSTNPDVPPAIREEMSSYGYPKDEFVDNNHFPYHFYVREALRLQGEYIMTEHDILTHRSKPDAILLGSHWLDCHSLQKVALSDTSYLNEGNIWVETHHPYEIPYRAMLPLRKECTNLIVPVCVSSSHVAFCSIRLESTWMQLGHAAAIAIDEALKNKKLPVQDVPIKILQQRLRNEKMVVTLADWKE